MGLEVEAMIIPDGITNPVVRTAIAALQAGDKAKWLSLFAQNAVLLDDGQPRDFLRFSEEALGHELFRSIDQVHNQGLSIEGQFHSDTWGDFRTYFRFTLDGSNKIIKLDIGQAS
jgi:hypothetical protein